MMAITSFMTGSPLVPTAHRDRRRIAVHTPAPDFRCRSLADVGVNHPYLKKKHFAIECFDVIIALR
jgi:hypothetical protein